MKKSRTTPYHPMGNGMVERFNSTLLNMMGTLTDTQKRDWKSYVPSLTHAYNAAIHESTGHSPYFLMFGRHPRLAIDAFLGIPSQQQPQSRSDYVDQLRSRLATAYKLASDESKKTGKRYKKYYDNKVRHATVMPGDRVLVRKVGLKGRQKLADKWETEPYLVTSQPIPDIPVYRVKPEHSSTGKSRLLHRNMLLPFTHLPCEDTTDVRKRNPRQEVPSSESSDEVEQSMTDPDEDPLSTTCSVPSGNTRSRTRQRQKSLEDCESVLSSVDIDIDATPIGGSPALNPDDFTLQEDSHVASEQQSSRFSAGSTCSDVQSSPPHRDVRRPSRRQRQPPQWIRSGEFITSPQWVFEVPASDVVYFVISFVFLPQILIGAVTRITVCPALHKLLSDNGKCYIVNYFYRFYVSITVSVKLFLMHVGLDMSM